MEVESININYDQWLTCIIGRNVYRIKVDDDFVNNVRSKTLNEYCQLIELQSSPVFLYAKVPVNSLQHAKFLQEFNFNLIETNITFVKSIEKKDVGQLDIRFADNDDQDEVVNLARRNFVYSRFHIDNDIPLKLANSIKAEWSRNYFLGKRGDQMVVALVDGTIAGFLQILFGSNKDLIIDLIAVDAKHHGKGIATNMITYAQNQLQQFKNIRAGTQLVNLPSIKLYEKAGFCISGAQYVFHYHNK